MATTESNIPLADAALRSNPADDKSEIKAGDLWATGPALVVVLRRPGCLLCREQALHIWEEREQFKSMRLVCVLHEWKEREVEAFREYWGGEIFFDSSKAFYAAVHSGKIKRGNVIDLLNPFSRAWRNVRRAKESKTVKDHNLIGDGLTMGGVMVFRQGGRVEYQFAEATFGDHAPFDELVNGAKRASQ